MEADEQRSAPRQGVVTGAFITFDSGQKTISCIVRQLSATGARIGLVSTSGIPANFTLRIPGGGDILCRLIWHTEGELGVAFIDSMVFVSFAAD